MSWYQNHILPHIINCGCGVKAVAKERSRIVPRASGVVLEVGMGSGLNLPFYRVDAVKFVWGLEPSEAMRKRAKINLDATRLEVRWLDLPGEQIPLEDNSVDSVVTTFTLCSIPGWREALAHMRRVLKPDGKLFFVEHGLSSDSSVARWQHRINPVWNKMMGGCNLNRDIPEGIHHAGFEIKELDTHYLKNAPRFGGYIYSGYADC